MWNFKMYFGDGQEHFVYDPWSCSGAAGTENSYPYLESLLSFLELDCTKVQSMIQEILACWDHFFSAGDTVYADNAMGKMGELAALHIYFRLPYLQWFTRKAEGTLDPEMTKELLQLSEQLPAYQHQAQTFLEQVLDIDRVGRETQENARGKYGPEGPRNPELFPFQTVPVSFGPVSSEACGPILHPGTVRDLIDFSLRECVMRGIPVRRCKNCGRYFPLTGRVTAEYCERPNADRKPCRNTGAVQKWEEGRKDDLVFKEYRREYKRRFAWIRAGKLTEDEFTAWSKRARDKKGECDQGYITLEEFSDWLKNSG